MKVSEFKFRGRRNYLHSTTVLNWILKDSGASGVDMDFHFNARTDRQVFFLDHAPQAGGKVIGKYTDISMKLYLVESAQGIVGAEPYAEDEIGRHCQLSGEVIAVPCRLPGFTDVECVVAGYKFLLDGMFPDLKGRFAFARLQWKSRPDDMLDIRFRRRISGQLYEGTLLRSGETQGAIVFGEWQ